MVRRVFPFLVLELIVQLGTVVLREPIQNQEVVRYASFTVSVVIMVAAALTLSRAYGIVSRGIAAGAITWTFSIVTSLCISVLADTSGGTTVFLGYLISIALASIPLFILWWLASLIGKRLSKTRSAT